MHDETLSGEIQTFLADTFLIGFGPDVGADTDLFAAKYIDSYGFVELVVFLEQTYRIKLSDNDLADPRMGSLAGIESLIRTKRVSAAP